MAKEIENRRVVEIEVPEGMSPEQYKKLTGTFLKARETGKRRDKAIMEATKALKKQYKADFKKLLDTELKKVNLPVKA